MSKENYREIYLQNHPEITEIPKGYVIHHKDLNHYNNDPENLEMLTISEHIKLHANIRISKPRSEEGNKKCSESLKGKPWSEARRLACKGGGFKGRKHTEETKEKNRQAQLGRNKGDKNGRWIKITEEMIEDYKNGIKRIDFYKKYNIKSQCIWDRLRNGNY